MATTQPIRYIPNGTPDTSNPTAVAKRIGREYVERPRFPGEMSDGVRNAYRKLARIVADLFGRIPVDVMYQSDDPYDSYEDMRVHVMETEGVLRIYDGHADAHPFLSESENLQFRAVHDWHGHLAHDVDFSPSGEFKKWYYMSQDMPSDVRRILLADVVGQVGAVHYLDGGFANDRFEQRAFKAPLRWYDWMAEAVDI